MSDDRQLALIVALNDGDTPQELPLLKDLAKLHPEPGWSLNVIFQPYRVNLATTYNDAMRQSTAKHKLYIDKTARLCDRLLLRRVAVLFSRDDQPCGAYGLYGSELPLNGDFTRSRHRYGRHCYLFDGGTDAVSTRGENSFATQPVHVVDSAFFLTGVDAPWDEDMDDRLAVAAQCCQLRRRGAAIVVPPQSYDLAAVNRPCDYNLYLSPTLLAKFYEKYRDVICPLVSVLIPTYNQPRFFRQALESALAQDYPNVEILVGDDSTDERTEQLMQPYLAQHAHIRYEHHGKPLGSIGNATTLLNQARGEYVNFLFHDDLFAPTKIRRMMEWYVADLRRELALVTSARNEIDADGRKRSLMSPWQPTRDTVFDTRDMARDILTLLCNSIGEMTTVLLRRDDLRQSDGRYALGVFCGVKDAAMSDVATFLALFRRYRKAAFLADVLSSFRLHGEGQATGNPRVMLNAIMDWTTYVTMSYLNGLFFSADEIPRRYDNCRVMSELYLGGTADVVRESEDAQLTAIAATVRELHSLLAAKDYDAVVRLVLRHRAGYAYDRAAFAETYADYLE